MRKIYHGRVCGVASISEKSKWGILDLLTTAPGSRRPWELAVVAPLLVLVGYAFLVVLAGLMLIILKIITYYTIVIRS